MPLGWSTNGILWRRATDVGQWFAGNHIPWLWMMSGFLTAHNLLSSRWSNKPVRSNTGEFVRGILLLTRPSEKFTSELPANCWLIKFRSISCCSANMCANWETVLDGPPDAFAKLLMVWHTRIVIVFINKFGQQKIRLRIWAGSITSTFRLTSPCKADEIPMLKNGLWQK